MTNDLLVCDTAANTICKNIEYIEAHPTTRTATIIVNNATRAQDEMLAINKKLSGEPYLPCQCDKCRTTAN
jgi:hypothetical protein